MMRSDRQTTTITAEAQTKVILSDAPLPLRATFYPLGFAVEVETNHPEVLVAASESWGHLRHTQPSQVLHLRVYITDGSSPDYRPAPTIRGHRHLISIVADAENHAICDLDHGSAHFYLNAAGLNNRSYLRYYFLEAAALTLISTLHTTPLHAACVSLHGRGILLCGPSGAGKSSLAYACARRGWIFTTDDASYLLNDGHVPRIVGNSHQVRFRPSARDLFPELNGYSITPRAEGKPSVEIPTTQLPGIATSEEAALHAIVFLDRQPSTPVQLSSISSAEALRRLQVEVFPLEQVRKRQIAAIDRLAGIDAYELRYSNLDSAIHQLELLARDDSASFTHTS